MITSISMHPSRVKGACLYEMHHVIDDMRGHLTVGRFIAEVPFQPARYFITHGIPSAQTRGEHAHRQCAQFLLCTHGSCSVLVDDGRQREEFRLDHPSRGLYVPSMVWAAEFNHSPDSTLLVFASHDYDPADYIRDYAEFCQASNALSS